MVVMTIDNHTHGLFLHSGHSRTTLAAGREALAGRPPPRSVWSFLPAPECACAELSCRTRASARLPSVLTPPPARDSCFTLSRDHFTRSLVLPPLVYFLCPHPCSGLFCPALFSSQHGPLSSSATLLAGQLLPLGSSFPQQGGIPSWPVHAIT